MNAWWLAGCPVLYCGIHRIFSILIGAQHAAAMQCPRVALAKIAIALLFGV